MSNHKIKKITIITKEALAEKEETGTLPKKHSAKGKNYVPKNTDQQEYEKTARLRAKLKNKNNPRRNK